MINISKTHSKKDLYDLIEEFKIPVYLSNPTKSQLINSLQDALAGELYKISPNNKFIIKDKKEFIKYLEDINPRKILSVKEKKKVIYDCKRLKQFCLNSYCIIGTEFINDKEVEDTINEVSKYGDIPSVRKVISLYNKNPCIKKHIKPIISKIIENELQAKRSLKQTTLNIMTIKQGPFTISFD
tara:strand:- start:6550 stop:7101 length:552 start_codon:yes stop_codon:yes gene_type:complete